jgi:hypothetical protein
MIRIVLVVWVLLCSGCTSINTVDSQVYWSLKRFREVQIKRLIDYIESDSNLTGRDKNTFRIELEDLDESLGKLTEKN